MVNRVALNNEIHRDVRIAATRPTRENAAVSTVSVIPREFPRLLAHYPIFYTKNMETGRFEPSVLLGFEPGENLFFILIGKHFGVPFLPTKDALFIDKAWAVQIPYSTDEAAIDSVTVSTAQSSGWVWDIGLTTRRGVGYVFSGGHVSDEDALEELMNYLSVRGDRSRDLSFRKIDINSGYRREFWIRNCAAVGLSAGFIEPLEASAIVIIELSAKSIANLLPGCRQGMQQAARIFNNTFRYRWERIVDFLKLHYVLSRRNDSRFWIDNRAPESIPNSLRDCLEYWREHCPWHEDFAHREEVFSAASYQYILYGMGFKTHRAPWLLNERDRILAQEKMSEARKYTRTLAASLPGNRALLSKVRAYGLQRI